VTLVVLLGGARSGKSALAVELASQDGVPVTFVATGAAGDEEMAERIAMHRADRPRTWRTVEESIDLQGAVARLDNDGTAIVDCLSLWVANVLERGVEDARVEEEARAASALAAARTGLTIAVSNEVGLGIVPVSPLARRYRDLLGRVNAVWVDAADEAYFVVAGKRLALR
jgi:adenosyl cobinamide kinase/adenosyl cobinamide phosphate guanylyltransferase